MNALRMALDSIREKKGRSFLTMLGIIRSEERRVGKEC